MNTPLYNRVDMYVYSWSEEKLPFKLDDHTPYGAVLIPASPPDDPNPVQPEFIKAYMLKLAYTESTFLDPEAPILKIIRKEFEQNGIKDFYVHGHRNPPENFPPSFAFSEDQNPGGWPVRVIFDSFENGQLGKPFIGKVLATPIGREIDQLPMLDYDAQLVRAPIGQVEFSAGFDRRLRELSARSTVLSEQETDRRRIQAISLQVTSSSFFLADLPQNGPVDHFHRQLCGYVHEKISTLEQGGKLPESFRVNVLYLRHRDWDKRDIVKALTGKQGYFKCFPSNHDLTVDSNQQRTFHDYNPHIFLASHKDVSSPVNQSDSLVKNFMDSSIWTQLLYLEDIPSIEWLGDRIVDLFQNAILFQKEPCLEYIEFNSRMLRNAFLSGPHKTLIPFPFHSETGMAEFARKALRDIAAFLPQPSSGDPARFTWRCLLLDDRALVGLGDTIPAEKAMNGATLQVSDEDRQRVIDKMEGDIWSKADILCRLFRQFGIETITKGFNAGNYIQMKAPACPGDPNTRITIKLYCAQTLEEAVCMIKQRSFDIILLDHLLALDTHTVPPRPRSGVELLRKINEEDWGYPESRTVGTDPQNPPRTDWSADQVGPFGKFWIFGISSYQTSFVEQVRNQGLTLLSDKWNLFRGACPVNTPQLFMQQFMNFLLIQLKEAQADLVGMVERIASRTVRILALKDDEKAEAFRRTATDLFGGLMYLVGKQERQKQDIERGSGIAKSLYNSTHKYDFEEMLFIDHARQLLYLISYGNGRQWEEMYQEYIILKDIHRYIIKKDIRIARTDLGKFWKVTDFYIHRLRDQFETA